MSGIEWTDETWNPVIGCTPVSAGCLNCYAATMARRLEAMGRPEYRRRCVHRESGEPASDGIQGLLEGKYRTVRIAEVRGGRAVFTGDVRLQPQRLHEPLHWRKPRRIFVCSMSDLFHPDVPFDFIDEAWAIMALCPQHTFQVLTKRPERMAEYLARPWMEDGDRWLRATGHLPAEVLDKPMGDIRYPLPNVWLGTSVEDQKAADERIPHLLRCPAAVRFLSCEPLLGPVDLLNVGMIDGRPLCALSGHPCVDDEPSRDCGVNWVIVGGESGPHARPCDVAWIRGVVGQCSEAGVPVFVKQLGTAPYGFGPRHITLCDRKGGDPAEWPKDLRVRQWPQAGGGA